jgi:hypothetical protein
MAANSGDLEKMSRQRSSFQPLLIGWHWPSLPWGDENISLGSAEESIDAVVSHYADRVADTPAARQALQTIFTEASRDMMPDELSAETIAAYNVLNAESGLSRGGLAAPPGADGDPFDAANIYQESIVEEDILPEGEDFGIVDTGRFILSRIFSPLRVLSYWQMKERARQFGENEGFNFLVNLQKKAAPSVRFHLMGHSFGCIVMSATLAGKNCQGVLPRSVNSLCLIQGALSLWSYCADITIARGKSGYFNAIVCDGKVAGPIVATLSQHDTAVGTMYPLASGVAMSDLGFDIYPKYGAIGTFGIQGDGVNIEGLEMLPCDLDYNFQAEVIYNLQSSKYICKVPPGEGLSGAHSSIDEPEVAHAVWMAAMVS